MKRSLQEIAEAVEARLRGDGKVEVEGVASIGSASKHDLVFVEEEKYLSRALQSGAGAVIAGEFAAASSGKPLLISRHPKLAFARAARFLRDGNRDEDNAGVHPNCRGAFFGPSGAGRRGGGIRRGGTDAEIGEGTRIGAGCVDWARSEAWAGMRDLSEGHDLCRDHAGRSGDCACGRGAGKRWLRICARREEREATRNFRRWAGW